MTVVPAGSGAAPPDPIADRLAGARAVGRTVVLDPTSERAPADRPLAGRLDDLDGKVIGLLDISKPRGNVFLDRLAELLAARGADVRRYSKPTFTKPAPTDLRHELAVACHGVVEALAD
jgi:hypothetical protein